MNATTLKPVIKVNIDSKEVRLTPTVLLLTEDHALADLVFGTVKPPWTLFRQSADKYKSRQALTQPNVRLVILDDQAVEENDRKWLLAQIGKYFSGVSLLYVAGSQNDTNERRARTNGAHYYVSKPLSPERFAHVVQSFLLSTQVKPQTVP